MIFCCPLAPEQETEREKTLLHGKYTHTHSKTVYSVNHTAYHHKFANSKAQQWSSDDLHPQDPGSMQSLSLLCAPKWSKFLRPSNKHLRFDPPPKKKVLKKETTTADPQLKIWGFIVCVTAIFLQIKLALQKSCRTLDDSLCLISSYRVDHRGNVYQTHRVLPFSLIYTLSLQSVAFYFHAFLYWHVI